MAITRGVGPLAVACQCLAAIVAVGGAITPAPCDKSRRVFTEPSGIITDGPIGSNYTQDSHCEWLIKAANTTQFITLSFIRMGTECSYDYVFVYDGDSFDAPLLGSFSGKTDPQNVTASSGYMLILLYSDTNYVLDGFRAEFSVHNCPNNCTGRGACIGNKCYCNNNWSGRDCNIESCPSDCSRHGRCKQDQCHCNKGYSGESCSLNQYDKDGNSWHWLSRSDTGLTPRAAHSAVYVNLTDSLYVFGGYDLNMVLDSLQIYRFKTSQWEDEDGKIVRRYPSTEENEKNLLQLVLNKGIENWHVGNRSSIFNSLLSSFSHQDKSSLRRLGLYPNMSQFPDSLVHLNDEPAFLKHTFQNSDIRLKDMSIKPEARYGHAACAFQNGFVLYGGKLANRSLSSELWLYDAIVNQWSIRASNSSLRPPGLTRHTLTAVGDELYLFGGSNENGDFSSSMYVIRLGEPGSEAWRRVRVRGGKELDVRVVAHTAVYHAYSQAILVYGGVVASVARFSKLSDRMFAFDIVNRHWSEIHYPKALLRDTYVPRERAFHTANIIGNYLIVFGGYSHRHNREEVCYDGQMYLYHLGCHSWISLDVLGKTRRFYPKRQGVFAHASALRPPSTLLIVGGYHGNVNGDLLAYVAPSWSILNSEPESSCPRHRSQPECLADPECGWCTADEICYGRLVGSNCTTNLITIRCGGVCPTLGDCHSCLIHGRPPGEESANTTLVRKPLPSISTRLGLDHCSWCVQNARCHHKDDSYGVCEGDTPSQIPGWWGNVGTEVKNPEQCKEFDKRPGLTHLRYQQPADWNHPDAVSIVNATIVDWNAGGGTNHMITGPSEARLKGWLRIPLYWNGTGEVLHVCAAYANVSVTLGDKEQPVTYLVAQPSACAPVDWPSLEPGRMMVDMLANDSLYGGLYPSHHLGKMELQHNKSQETAKFFTFEYLEPYSNGSCQNYDNCLLCLSDAACGWCEVTGKCESRTADEQVVCSVDDDWRYLTLQPTACPNCTNYISCDSCVKANHCEWWAEEARCARRGRAEGAIYESKDCPVPCRARGDCEHCLDERGRCVWCEATKQCFSFSVYTSEYQFGMCREWLDKAPSDDGSRRADQCKSCQRHAECSSCLRNMGCGWCHSKGNPIRGLCTAGDFTAPHTDCSLALNTTSRDAGWAYAQCPDVDECGLGLHDCHEHAVCNNTHGSYSCKCKKGYIGDGKKSCDRTCYNTCIHGYCLGAPHYKCQCEYGWTGEDCSINCGCHNHSTCKNGVGKCDECLDWTEGEFCEKCKPGSYGNATTGEGCRSCDCNDHGDVNQKVCNVTTGVCFCKDNTEGKSCEKCAPNFYGDPRHGGRCYYNCEARGMLDALTTTGIGSFKSNPAFGLLEPPKECLWIVSTNGLKNAIIQFTINSSTLNVPCDENAVYVYDGLGGLPDMSSEKQSQLVGVFCNGASSGVVEARSGNLTVHYKQSGPDQGFEGVFTVLACEYNCVPPRTCRNGHCVCDEGLSGANCEVNICPNNCSMSINGGVCDRSYGRCVCSENFAGDDCSIILDRSQLVFTELFNSEFLADGQDHLKKTLPRFGHSLVVDRRGLWMFGGYSLSHGPLNDIRLFDTKNNTWMQVTVEATPDTKMPDGRYFHGADIHYSKQNIYVYGGLSSQDKNLQNKTLDDLWQFSLKNQRWSMIIPKDDQPHPPPLAGHTLTLQKFVDYESLVLIGGFSLENGFLEDIWDFDLDKMEWKKMITTGPKPIGIAGHSTVFHAPTQSLYIYGGILYQNNGTIISNKLFSFTYPTKAWSELPTFPDLNHPSDNLPVSSYLHSAITTNDYMIIFGGRTDSINNSDALLVYLYGCNQWIKLGRGVNQVGKAPPPTIAHAMAIDNEPESNGSIYIVGGWTGSAQCQVTRIILPEDLCALWSSNKFECKSHLGCSFCSTFNYTKCYSAGKAGCDNTTDAITVNAGEQCDGQVISRRLCENLTTCSSCLAAWPTHLEKPPACQWCESCGDGECVPNSESCTSFKCNVGTDYITAADRCPELACAASDCDKCISEHCTWTRLAVREGGITRISEDAIHNWTCAQTDVSGHPLRARQRDECPSRCPARADCQSCLRAEGAEGGFSECRWATHLNRCLSPAYQPAYCAGGVCGLVVRGPDDGRCPAPCASFTQCSTCLHHSHCGWCARADRDGDGVCTDGSMESPLHYLARAECGALYAAARHEPDSANRTFTWHYTRCPPENECENGHHTCDPVSQTCSDLREGYKCSCGPGYRAAGAEDACAPVCAQGCVRGACVQPDVCRCDFGYVGANCSIQCQCNGHADCEGPDKLASCLECHNNTMGNQCEKCKPLFVRDPSDSGQCMPCATYCHGHTDACAAGEHEAPRDARDADDIYRDTSGTRARCIRCANNTDGARCEKCIEGHFRGSDNFNDACRPCECHGHGDLCDPVTGEKCNCGNNTESDPMCQAAGARNSAQACWQYQCVKCRDLYSGDPKNGHQCYKMMNADNKMCFDSKSIDECKMNPRALQPGQTVYFAIIPRFMNVDIRVMVDVTQGAVDVYMSPNYSSFVVSVNASTGAHYVDIDPAYHPRDTFRKGSFNDHYSDKAQYSWSYDKTEYIKEEYTAEDLINYVTVDKRNTLLRVKNLQNRLVLTIPQTVHDLTNTRFFVILRALHSEDDAAAFGLIFFRQDQLHIDLFVFFSVFFSCFFLFLAVCVVAWKAKQAADLRRARRRHVVEMLHMAKRPFASVTVVLDGELCGAGVRGGGAGARRRRKGREARPVAIEHTQDGVAAVMTVLVRLPGGSQAPVRMALASSLVLKPYVLPSRGARSRRLHPT